MAFEECYSMNLRRANRVLTQYYDRYLADLGLRISQYSILRTLKYMGEGNQKTIQEVLVMDQTTLTRNLKPLLRDGFIQTRPGEDKRERLVSLTPEGKALYTQATVEWKKAQKALNKTLGEDVMAQVLSVSGSLVHLKD
ncbi:MAG: MarR family winged helix-turn-helix transcriptional regulator [Agarilytica sp.]